MLYSGDISIPDMGPILRAHGLDFRALFEAACFSATPRGPYICIYMYIRTCMCMCMCMCICMGLSPES